MNAIIPLFAISSKENVLTLKGISKCSIIFPRKKDLDIANAEAYNIHLMLLNEFLTKSFNYTEEELIRVLQVLYFVDNGSGI